jgi:hypothetical protein
MFTTALSCCPDRELSLLEGLERQEATLTIAPHRLEQTDSLEQRYVPPVSRRLVNDCDAISAPASKPQQMRQ